MTATQTTILFIFAAFAIAQACSPGYLACGHICYNPRTYCCPNGQVLAIAKCNVASTTKSTTVKVTPTTSSTKTPAATPTSSVTPVPSTSAAAPAPTTSAAAPVPTTSAAAATPSPSQCGAGLAACGNACYNPSEGTYCCVNGQLTQMAFCTDNTPAPTSQAQATSKAAAVPSTTKAAVVASTQAAAVPSTTKAVVTPSKPATSSTTKAAAATTSAAATTAAVVAPPAPAPVLVNTQSCGSSPCPSGQSCCAGKCYDPTLYGCSSSANGTAQFLCPAPASSPQSSFWLGNIKHEGTSPFLNDKSYVVYRNVKDFGAKGDGVTDDTSAINAAITAYGRCGLGCDSTTTRPAVVFFPPGVYVISTPIIQYYYTQLIGDATNLPTIKAAAGFGGMAMIDSDPYGSNGNWYTNQNNFYRQVRNFIIDTTATPDSKGTTCIHWQVAQATSLVNIVFRMSQNSGNKHQGVWMENGSGGMISDLIFYGGATALWVGNQQFTSRNISIYNSATGVYMNWNWGWTFKSLYISGAKVAFDMSSTGDKGQQLVGSVVLLDVQIANSEIGIRLGTGSSTSTATSASLLVDNAYFVNTPVAIASTTGTTLVAGSTGTTYVPTWGQGHVYNQANSGTGTRGFMKQAKRPTQLTDASSKTNYYFEKQRPQYENHPATDFISIKSVGAYGDGVHDDTVAIQTALYKYAGCRIIFFPAGAYIISDTVTIPAGSRIVGEAWPQLMAKGQNFQDASNPRPMIQVGLPGDVGVAELSDLLFTAQGPQPGAILVQWNIKDPQGAQGSAGMWDCHFRVAGAAGTNQQIPQCPKFGLPTPQCMGTFMLMHVTSTASAYLENVWMWTADHDLDAFGSDMSGQISVFNGRGLLLESTAGTWLYGTAVEHNVFYQYQLDGAENVLLAMIQTETPYFQATPPASIPWAQHVDYNDPDFSDCPAGSLSCGMAWGMRYIDNNNIYLYGAGHYNFFQNYNQTCLLTEDCQDAMIDIQSDNTSEMYLYGMNTKATVNMVHSYGEVSAVAADNVNTFCSTIHYLANAQ